MREQVREPVREQVQEPVREQVREPVREQVREPVRGQVLPRSQQGKVLCIFFWILPCPSVNARHQGSRYICNRLFCGSYRFCGCV